MKENVSRIDCREDILDITKKLVGIKSEVNTNGEIAAAEAIYNMLEAHPYFKENPSQLVMPRTINDERERYNVMAYVKGTKGESNRTVVLMGHMDTVGVDDFGANQALAFKPDEWKAHLTGKKLTEAIQAQVDSDDWMFGRGVLDMKSGTASNIYLLTQYASNPDQLDGNSDFIAEGEDADGSQRILSALQTLKRGRE